MIIASRRNVERAMTISSGRGDNDPSLNYVVLVYNRPSHRYRSAHHILVAAAAGDVVVVRRHCLRLLITSLHGTLKSTIIGDMSNGWREGEAHLSPCQSFSTNGPQLWHWLTNVERLDLKWNALAINQPKIVTVVIQMGRTFECLWSVWRFDGLLL